MANDIAPGYVKVKYYHDLGALNFNHTAVIPVIPEPDGSSGYVLTRKDGSTPTSLSAAMTTWTTVTRALLPTAVTISSAELWVKPTPTSDPQFAELVAIGVAGTAAVSVPASNQITLTYRSTEGGHGRAVILSTGYSPNQSYLPPSFGGEAVISAWAQYITGATTWIACRDNGFASAPIQVLTKTNDPIRRRLM